VPLDFIVLGGVSEAPRTAAEGGAWETALEPLLGGTAIRLPRPSVSSARKADRAWRELSEERREEIREFVRRIAVVAVAIEALLPAKAAKTVTDELGAELSTVVVDRILAARSRRPLC
jgi:hypothetical protein